jgi:integrase
MTITVREVGPKRWHIDVAGVLPDGSNFRKRTTQALSSKTAAQQYGENIWKAKLAGQHIGIRKSVTVSEYATQWLAEREKRGLSSAVTNRYELARILPELGHIELSDLKREHVAAAVRWLERHGTLKRGTGRISPRSVRHTYTTLRTMLADAVTDGTLTVNPATLRAHRDEVPTVKDKDPLWRRTAVYTPAELVALTTDARLTGQQRMAYALEALAGLRYGEASALRWSSWNRDKKPLGELAIFEAYDSNNDRLKETKTGVDRHVPVHAVLAELLDAWWAKGWAKAYGRTPRPDDLVIPVRDGKLRHRHKLDGHRLHAKALELLGMSHRRQHDLRRTFITLCIAGGADRNLLKWVSHGPPEGIVIDSYTSPPWPLLCAQVSALKLESLAA